MNSFFCRSIKLIFFMLLTPFYKILGVDKIYKSHLYYDIDSLPSTAHYCLILGSKLFDDDSITPMLARRMDFAVTLFNKRPDITFILSGDASKRISNDVQAMYLYLKQHCAISDKQIIFDNEGYTTLDSIKHITPDIDSKGFIILTSAFHMPRCVYICHILGLHPYALHIPPLSSGSDSWYRLRELSALVKTWFLLKFGSLQSHRHLYNFNLHLAFLSGKSLFAILRFFKKLRLYCPGKIALTLFPDLFQHLTEHLSIIFIVGINDKTATCLALENKLKTCNSIVHSNPSEECTLYEAASILVSYHSIFKHQKKQYIIFKCKNTEFYKIAKEFSKKKTSVFVTDISSEQSTTNALKHIRNCVLCGIDQIPDAVVYLNKNCSETLALSNEIKNTKQFYTLDDLYL